MGHKRRKSKTYDGFGRFPEDEEETEMTYAADDRKEEGVAQMGRMTERDDRKEGAND